MDDTDGKEIKSVWNLEKVTTELNDCFLTNSERKLLDILKTNSFLFYELYSRKMGIQPIFHEVEFGNKLRCDFVWLNDNSDGPEWVLLEVEQPNMPLFTKANKPTYNLSHAIEQVKSWRRYFDENPAERNRIFGAVSRFRFVIVAGSLAEWQKEKHAKWRVDNNKATDIKIHSFEIFRRPLEILKENPGLLWSFAEHPKSMPSSKLQEFWKDYDYMDLWRKYTD